MAKSLQAIVEIAGTLNPTLSLATKQAEKALGGINLKAVAASVAMGGIAIATGKAVISATKHLANLGNEYNKAINGLSAATGKTGEDLEKLGEVVKGVYGDNFGESLEAAAQAVGEVEKLTKLSGDALEEATESAFILSDTFGYEISESTRTASALMKNLGVDAGEAYNIIAYGAQNGADQNGDLLDTLNEYAAQYAGLGLSAGQFVSGLTAASDAGVFSIDKVGDAVKEFNIRSKDLSDSSAEAYKSLGMNADTMFKRFAEGGDSANTAFFEVVGALENMDDPLKKNQAAVALFGTMYEDLGSDILPILSSMQNATLDNVDTLEQINKVKYNDLGQVLEAIGRKAEVSFLPLATTVADSIMDIMPLVSQAMDGLLPIFDNLTTAIIPIVQQLMPQLIPLFQEFVPVLLEMAGSLAEQLLPPLMDMIQEILPVLLPLISQIMPLLAKIITAIMPIFIKLLTTLLPPIMKIITAILPVIINLINTLLPIFMTVIDLLMPILDIILQLIDPIVNLINSGVTPLIAVIGTLITQVLLALGPALEFIAGIFSGAVKGAIEGIKPIIESLMQVFTGIIDFINNIFSGNWSAAWDSVVQIFDGIISGITGVFKVPINFVIGGINEFLGGINGIAIPDWVPAVGGLSFNIPLIPMLAKGGFTEGISIAGEAGTEAVISFNPAVRGANIGYWEQAGEMLGVYDSSTATAGNLLNMNDFSLSELSQPSTSIIYDFSGLTWSPVVEGGTAEENDDMLRKLKSHEAEFFDWLERWLQQREVTAYA